MKINSFFTKNFKNGYFYKKIGPDDLDNIWVRNRVLSNIASTASPQKQYFEFYAYKHF